MGAFYVGSIRGDLNLRMKGLELYGNMLGMLRKGLTTYQPAKKSLTNLDEDVAGYTILIFEVRGPFGFSRWRHCGDVVARP